jgi:hypothetical protein
MRCAIFQGTGTWIGSKAEGRGRDSQTFYRPSQGDRKCANPAYRFWADKLWAWGLMRHAVRGIAQQAVLGR